MSDAGAPAIDQTETDLLLKGEKILYIYGKITYSDVFGKQHQTTYCNFVRKDLMALTSCDSYNDAN